MISNVNDPADSDIISVDNYFIFIYIGENFTENSTNYHIC